MSLTDAILLFLVMATLAFIPSSSVILVVTRSVTHGISNGIAVSLGVVFGDLVLVLLAILGLSIVANTMGWLFLLIKYIGATYLIWFGYSLLTTTSTTLKTVKNNNSKGSLITRFMTGVLITLGDIKAIVFYVSLFPIFVNIEALGLGDIVMILFITLFSVGGVKILYAFLASKLSAMSKGSTLERMTKKVAGGWLLGVGSYLMVKP